MRLKHLAFNPDAASSFVLHLLPDFFAGLAGRADASKLSEVWAHRLRPKIQSDSKEPSNG